MMGQSLALTMDLSRPLAFVGLALGAWSLVLLLWELKRRRGAGLAIASTGMAATTLLVAAVLRPAVVKSRGSLVGPRVVVLADRSLSMDLPGDEGTRRATLDAALVRLQSLSGQARMRVFGFGEGPAIPWETDEGKSPTTTSDLGAALAALAAMPDERPAALIVLSDGRLDRPSADAPGAEVRELLGHEGIPVHTVALASQEPRDASIRAVRAAGAAVAHQPLPLTIEIVCGGGLGCDERIPVSARELRDGAPPAVLASGEAQVRNGVATVELSITLERAGPRIVEVAIQPPDGDQIPDNDRRLITFQVARDRVRVLHVAGRPTYDVRALRMWLKSNASIDVVAFFILRTHSDDVHAVEEELALIPFPVHELFTEHLPSFDAVVLQDFNAAPYELLQHLPALARYVEHGGGLVMVGGPDSFSGGHYARTRLADVLPVELLSDAQSGEAQYDLAPFVPNLTEVARAVPVLRNLRGLLGDTLPEMVGANRVGNARAGSFVLWTHPKLTTPSGAPMPLLALGEKGDGRAIALALDASYRLAYSPEGAQTSGRGHGALWDGLLGWLMREPRYEPAQVDVIGPCVAGRPLALEVRPLPGSDGTITLDINTLENRRVVVHKELPLPPKGESSRVRVSALEPGGYSARVRIGNGPATRRDFACERGGDEWADPRPDLTRLRTIAAATGGVSLSAHEAGQVPLPPALEVSAERHVSPVLPAWLWSLLAAISLGAHWITRRRTGLA